MASKQFSHDYRRIAQIWKELGLESLLEKQVPITHEEYCNLISTRFPIERIDGKRPRQGRQKKRRSNEEWRTLLVELYMHLSIAKANPETNESVKSHCDNMLKDPTQCRRINDVWRKLGLNNDLEQNVCYNDSNLRNKINLEHPTTATQNNERQPRNLAPESLSHFDKDEEDALCEIVAGFALLGYPLEKGNLRDICNEYLKVDAPGALGGTGVSTDTIERIYKDDNIKAKGNINPIDPKRAAQADPQVLNAFFHQLDTAIKMANECNPAIWPEDRCANVPASCIYNCNEQGPNPTKLRNPVLIPADMLQEKRIFQNTREGDGKMQFHYAVANIVRADGVQCHPYELVEGSPAPMVIMSDPSSVDELDGMEKSERDKRLSNQKATDEIRFNDAVLEGWFDCFEVGKRDAIVNKFGFQVRTTPTGSVLKRTFFDFVHHFKDNLPHNQGPGGRGCWMTLPI